MTMQNPEAGGMITDSRERAKLSSRAINFALLANIFLALLKTIVGIFSTSAALLADGINSTSDIVYNIAVGIFVRSAEKPADDEHPYGHSQYESIGALVVSAFIITAAFTIFWNAISTLIDYFQNPGDFNPVSPIALYVAIFTILLKAALYFYTRKIGDKTDNPTILAMALDHRNDILSAFAVVAGTLASQFGFYWADPLAGAIVAVIFLISGIQILRDSTDILMDTVPGKALDARIRKLLVGIPGLAKIESIQAHRFGQYMVINITIGVDGEITVRQGHETADEVEKCILENLEFVRAVHVHYHPKSE